MLVVLLFALGIGSTATMFTVLYELVLKPLPFSDPERLVVIQGAASVPDGDTLGWWGQAASLDGICLLETGGINLSEGAQSERAFAAAVSPSFFTVFKVAPGTGRALVADDATPGHDHVAILSDRLWKAAFGADPQVIGRSISVNGADYTVVGVATPGFEFPGRIDLWIPLPADGASFELGAGRGGAAGFPAGLTTMIGRLKDGATVAATRSELRTLQARLQDRYSKSGVQFGSPVGVQPLQERVTKEYRPALMMLFTAVGLLLIVGCANAANILLARSASRQKEIAILMSFGASRTALVGQLLAESLMLSSVGAAIGILLTYSGIGAIRLWGADRTPGLADLRVNTVVVAFTALTSIAVGIGAGLVPALTLVRSGFGERLKAMGTTGASGLGRRARNMLVVVEIALALMLVVGAGLSAESFFKLARVAPGFDAGRLLTMRISLPWSRYGEPTPSNNTGEPRAATGAYKATEFYQEAIDQLKGLPGVVTAAAVSHLPLDGSLLGSQWVDAGGNQGCLAQSFEIQGDYFQAMGIPLLAGRSFDNRDRRNSDRVAIVASSLAQTLWATNDVIGKTIKIDEADSRRIVAVVGDARYNALSADLEPEFYVPCSQPFGDHQPTMDIALIVKTAGDPTVLAGPAKDKVEAIDKEVPAFQVKAMDRVVSESLYDYRFRGVLLGLFASLAAFAAVAGIYGAVSYSVQARRREIGIRLAVGASQRNVLLMVLWEAVQLSAAGVAIGALGAVALTRLGTSLLYGVLPNDPATLIGAVLLLVVAELSSSLFPAVGASRVDPANILRYE